MKEYVCPICGFDKLSFVPLNSYEICPCCGYEFGTFDYYSNCNGKYFDLLQMGASEEDETLFSMVRKIWLDDGAIWFAKDRKLDDWNLANQLENLKKINQ